MPPTATFLRVTRLLPLSLRNRAPSPKTWRPIALERVSLETNSFEIRVNRSFRVEWGKNGTAIYLSLSNSSEERVREEARCV